MSLNGFALWDIFKSNTNSNPNKSENRRISYSTRIAFSVRPINVGDAVVPHTYDYDYEYLGFRLIWRRFFHLRVWNTFTSV